MWRFYLQQKGQICGEFILNRKDGFVEILSSTERTDLLRFYLQQKARICWDFLNNKKGWICWEFILNRKDGFVEIFSSARKDGFVADFSSSERMDLWRISLRKKGWICGGFIFKKFLIFLCCLPRQLQILLQTKNAFHSEHNFEAVTGRNNTLWETFDDFVIR